MKKHRYIQTKKTLRAYYRSALRRARDRAEEAYGEGAAPYCGLDQALLALIAGLIHLRLPPRVVVGIQAQAEALFKLTPLLDLVSVECSEGGEKLDATQRTILKSCSLLEDYQSYQRLVRFVRNDSTAAFAACYATKRELTKA
jgi:hypothetical protein